MMDNDSCPLNYSPLFRQRLKLGTKGLQCSNGRLAYLIGQELY